MYEYQEALDKLYGYAKKARRKNWDGDCERMALQELIYEYKKVKLALEIACKTIVCDECKIKGKNINDIPSGENLKWQQLCLTIANNQIMAGCGYENWY